MQHFELSLSFQISPSTAPTTKSDTWTSPSTAPAMKSNTWTSPSTAPTTQSDTWTSPSTAPATKSATWPSSSTAPTTKSDTWPSPTTAPATQNDSQAWSSSHMKRHFQCEEQQMSPSKLTTYCACHAKWPSNIWQKFAENSWNVISNARPIRTWSDHVPRPFRDRFRQSATRHATEVTFRAPDERFVLKNTTFRAPAIFPNFTKYCACHEKWHLNFTKYCAYHEKWHLNFTKYCAYHAKWHLNFTKYCAYHAKWHLNFTKYCAYHEKWHLTFTNYCACHTEWLAGLILVTYETSFPMRGATNVTLQTHHILRLPRKMTIQHLAEICGKQLKRHFQCAADPNMIRSRSETVSVSPQPATQQRLLFALRTNGLYWKIQHFALRLSFQISPSTAPTTKSDTSTSPSTAPTTKSDTSTSPSTAPTTQSDTWTSPSTAPTTQSDTWPSPTTVPTTQSDTWNLTKYYAYHEKWHLISAIYYAAILLSDSLTLLLLSDLLLRDSINWLYSYAAIVIDSTLTQRF